MTRRSRTINGHGRAPKLVRPLFLGVATDAWTDLPPAQYPEQVVDLIANLLAAGERLARIDIWRCSACRKLAVTNLLHPGVVPTTVDHRRFEPGTRCHGTMLSLGYPEGADQETPTHEFYRPGERELMDLDDVLIDYVLRGGLLLRPVAKP